MQEASTCTCLHECQHYSGPKSTVRVPWGGAKPPLPSKHSLLRGSHEPVYACTVASYIAGPFARGRIDTPSSQPCTCLNRGYHAICCCMMLPEAWRRITANHCGRASMEPACCRCRSAWQLKTNAGHCISRGGTRELAIRQPLPSEESTQMCHQQ